MNIQQFLGIRPRVSAADQGKIIYAADVTAPDQRDAVRGFIKLVNDPSGTGGPRFRPIKSELTPQDCATVTSLIQRQMRGDHIGGLDNLPELQGQHGLDLLEGVKRYYRPSIAKQSDTATVAWVNIDTLRYPEQQATARAIAEQFGNVHNSNVLDAAALQRAANTLRLQGAASLTQQIPKLAQVPNFKRSIEYLVAFMDRARNGAADHGPFVVNGVALQSVYRLAKLPQYVTQKDEPEGQRLDATEKMLNDFEAGFQDGKLDRVGYDRVYIDGNDGNLYLGLRNDGNIKDVARNDQGWFMARPIDDPSAFGPAQAAPGEPASLTRNMGTPERTGKVLRVVNVPNSMREAATGSFWNLMLSTFNNAKKKGDDGVPLYVGSMGPPPIFGGAGITQPNAAGPGLAGWASAIGGTALLTGLGGYAGSYITGGGLLTTAALIGASVTGIIGGAVALYMLTRYLSPQAVNPVWSAAGIAVNRKNIRADEV